MESPTVADSCPRPTAAASGDATHAPSGSPSAPGLGTVTTVDGRISLVRLDGSSEEVRCELRAALRGARGGGNVVAVGDRVHVALGAGASGSAGVIERVEERRTTLSRGRGKRRDEHVIAANVDQLLVLAAVRAPDWRPGFVDRMLCAAEKGGLHATIVASKADLLEPSSPAGSPGRARGAGAEVEAEAPDEDGARLEVERERAAILRERVEEDLAVYRALGYGTILASSHSGAGLDLVRAALAGKVTVIAGQSGVGKSTLLNAIEPGLGLRTREVSQETGKGKHTTTGTRLLALASGGFVLDTPGVKSFAMFDLAPREAGWLFREVHERAAGCRFRDCLHREEPHCAVRAAAEAGEIDGRRFESYLRLIDSLGEDAFDGDDRT